MHMLQMFAVDKKSVFSPIKFDRRTEISSHSSRLWLWPL